jgi:hypothetical protein
LLRTAARKKKKKNPKERMGIVRGAGVPFDSFRRGLQAAATPVGGGVLSFVFLESRARALANANSQECSTK